MTLDIAAIKARADKAREADRAISGADISHINGATSIEVAKAVVTLKATAQQDIPNLIAALEASEAARVKAEQENGSLAAWQCIHHDGKTGIVCTEHGHQICAKDARITALEAERDALMKAAYLKGRTEWCPAGILDDTERTERDWRDARRALEASK